MSSEPAARRLLAESAMAARRRRRRQAGLKRRGTIQGAGTSDGGAQGEELQAVLARHQESLPKVEPRKAEERKPERPVVTEQDLAARTPIAVTKRGRVRTHAYQPGI